MYRQANLKSKIADLESQVSSAETELGDLNAKLKYGISTHVLLHCFPYLTHTVFPLPLHSSHVYFSHPLEPLPTR
jgi:hypothetical protein